jgi:hypothetical protein
MRRLGLIVALAALAMPSSAVAAFLSKAVAHVATEHQARRFERARPEAEWTVEPAYACARISSVRVVCGFHYIDFTTPEPESCDFNVFVRLSGRYVYSRVERSFLCDE